MQGEFSDPGAVCTSAKRALLSGDPGQDGRMVRDSRQVGEEGMVFLSGG